VFESNKMHKTGNKKDNKVKRQEQLILKPMTGGTRPFFGTNYGVALRLSWGSVMGLESITRCHTSCTPYLVGHRSNPTNTTISNVGIVKNLTDLHAFVFHIEPT